MYPGERGRSMSILPQLTLVFQSGKSITHGPFVIDDAAPVPIHTGRDFVGAAGGLAFADNGLVWGPQDDGGGTPEAILSQGSDGADLAMFEPDPGFDEVCIVCEATLKGMKMCSSCKKAGEDVCPIVVRYCSAKCQKQDFKRHKKYCGKACDPKAVEVTKKVA